MGIRDFSLTLSFVLGMIVFLNFPHISTLVIFTSLLIVVFGLAMLVAPRKSPKILGVVELVVLFMEKKNHIDWANKLIRLMGSGLVATGLIFFVFVYNRLHRFTSDLHIASAALAIFAAFAIAENCVISSYKRKKLK